MERRKLNDKIGTYLIDSWVEQKKLRVVSQDMEIFPVRLINTAAHSLGLNILKLN